MHRITNVKIENFRSCKSVQVFLESYSPIVGYNNAGKTNILRAIQWVVQPSSLTDRDFCDKSLPVTVEVLIGGLSDEVLSAMHSKHRQDIAGYIQDGKLLIRARQIEPSCPKKDIEIEVACPSENIEWVTNPTGISQALKALFPDTIFIESMDNPVDDVTKNKSTTTLGKLLKELTRNLESTYRSKFEQSFSTVREKISFDSPEQAEEIQDFDRDINLKIQDYFPGLSMKVHFPMPSIEDIFKQGTVKIYNGSSYHDFDTQGHGAQRAIQMALIQKLGETSFPIEQKTTLLLVDEPELFLHPQAIVQVREAFKRLSKKGYQVIFSTHSPSMIEQSDITKTSIIHKSEAEGTLVRKRVKEALEKAIDGKNKQAEILFKVNNLGQILFAENVLVVEGSTERVILPHLIQCVTGGSVGEHKVALVEVRGRDSIHGTLSILREMDIPAKALTDLDFVFVRGFHSGILNTSDPLLSQCLSIMNRTCNEQDFEMNDKGLPKKTNGKKVSEAYELFAQEQDAVPIIEELHSLFVSRGYWFWTKGAIEKHLGLEGKQPKNWYGFVSSLEQAQDWRNIIDEAEHEFVTSLCEWITA